MITQEEKRCVVCYLCVIERGIKMGKISRVIAKDDLEAYPHTWTKGLDYELIEYEDYIKLASNEGHLNYTNKIKNNVLENFILDEHSK